jgi:serine/threonine protein kinase
MLNHFRKELKSKLENILYYMAEIASALVYLHAEHIVYRDLKAENILFDSMGHAKIADFGFAKRILTNRTKTVCGTPGYLSPEQLMKKEYGKEVDLWAYGVLLFELLSGYNPFFDRSPKVLYENILALNINWPSYMNPTAKTFIESLLVKDPAGRMQANMFQHHDLFKVSIITPE